MNEAIGFSVIYRWRLHNGMESQFCQAWERATKLLMDERGALGSRLHRAEDGTWVAYAQWPSKAVWETSRELGAVDPEVSRQMLEAALETLPLILLTPVSDFLRHGAVQADI
jgi:hypothetical protein